MSDQQPALRIDAAQQPEAYVVRVQGELDLAGRRDLDLALEEAEGPAPAASSSTSRS